MHASAHHAAPQSSRNTSLGHGQLSTQVLGYHGRVHVLEQLLGLAFLLEQLDAVAGVGVEEE